MKKSNNIYLVSEGIFSFLKYIVTGKGLNMKDIRKKDPRKASDLENLLNKIEDWGDTAHPDGGTWREYIERKQKDIYN